ncbi:MAG: CapA family protein, partial [Synergistaceae bacterium]|nr:CapA family protein [Synergistaceae bacterium]
DAIIALAGYIYEKVGKSKNKTLSALRKIGDAWGIPEFAIKNITGRFYENNPQFFTPEMLLKTAKQFLAFDFKNILSQKNISYKDKYFESDSVLDMPPISRYFSYSTGLSINAFCMCEFGDETLFIAVCGAKIPLERDQLMLEAIHRARVPLPEPQRDFIPTGKTALSICGDTYCGERYTKWRIARNIDDPIQRYGDDGYAYSYNKVAQLISQNTFNIVNSECVLSPVYSETQQTGKYLDFVLGAHPEKTVSCYKKVNIGAVMLANNHTMDLGAAGCRQTRKYFEEAGLNPIGTGSNIDEAENPLLIEMNGVQAIVFNAYCYYLEKRHKIFRHYCLGANTGAAFGTDILEDISLWCRIRSYREKHPNAFIVFSPHWSTDFNERHLHLRPIAAKAFDAGADITIGHGPHIPIGAEHVNGKICVYSVGNFVFNTTGIDLDASGKPPYGIVAQINFSLKDPELRLYPIYTHNLKTFFQPYPVTDKAQYEEFTASLIGLEKFETKKDDIGYYLRIVLNRT